MDQCNSKQDDDVALKVAERVRNVHDLEATECRYHGHCFQNFMKPISSGKQGRPPISDPAFLSSFEKLCDYIDSNDDQCQYDIRELIGIFQIGLTSPMIDERTLVKKLEARYKDNLKVAVVNGIPTQLFFFVAHQTMHKKSKHEREQIIRWAAEILNFEIRSRYYDSKTYQTLPMGPDRESMFSELLNLFMSLLILDDKKSKNRLRLERKVFAMQEIIISLIRERSYVPPLLTSLGIHLHRAYDSKYLNKLLFCLGLSCSYEEALSFATSATLAEEPKIALGAFTQMVFDNADINVRTLDGRNTFHAMGGIICASPHDSVKKNRTEKFATKIRATCRS